MEQEKLIELEAIIKTFQEINAGRCNYPTSLAMDRLTYDYAKLIKSMVKLAYDADLTKCRYKQWEAIENICEALMSLPCIE